MFNLKIEKSMRRLFYLSFVMVALFFSACSSNTPSKAMEKYLSELQDDDLEAFVDGMSFSDKLSDSSLRRSTRKGIGRKSGSRSISVTVARRNRLKSWSRKMENG